MSVTGVVAAAAAAAAASAASALSSAGAASVCAVWALLAASAGLAASRALFWRWAWAADDFSPDAALFGAAGLAGAGLGAAWACGCGWRWAISRDKVAPNCWPPSLAPPGRALARWGAALAPETWNGRVVVCIVIIVSAFVER